jgi:hypothetical protein
VSANPGDTHGIRRRRIDLTQMQREQSDFKNTSGMCGRLCEGTREMSIPVVTAELDSLCAFVSPTRLLGDQGPS